MEWTMAPILAHEQPRLLAGDSDEARISREAAKAPSQTPQDQKKSVVFVDSFLMEVFPRTDVF